MYLVVTPRTVLSLAECPIVYIHIITESANSDFCDLVHYHDSFAGITRVKTADGKTKLLGDVDFDNVAQRLPLSLLFLEGWGLSRLPW